MKTLTLRVKSWEEARKIAASLRKHVFRGQRDSSWPLETSLERATGSAYEDEVTKIPTRWAIQRAYLEPEMLLEFQRRAHHYLEDLPKTEDWLGWMDLIQHYGGPTRLLDFTRSFYVGAYFALEEQSKECAVWCVNRFWLNLALNREFDTSLNVAHPDRSELFTIAEILNQAIFEKSSKEIVFAVEPFKLHPRIAVQQGLFLCPSKLDKDFKELLARTLELEDDSMNQLKDEDKVELYCPKQHSESLTNAAIAKILLPETIHQDALMDLEKMNINQASLFPGLEGLARSLRYFPRRNALIFNDADAKHSQRLLNA